MNIFIESKSLQPKIKAQVSCVPELQDFFDFAATLCQNPYPRSVSKTGEKVKVSVGSRVAERDGTLQNSKFSILFAKLTNISLFQNEFKKYFSDFDFFVNVSNKIYQPIQFGLLDPLSKPELVEKLNNLSNALKDFVEQNGNWLQPDFINIDESDPVRKSDLIVNILNNLKERITLVLFNSINPASAK